MALSCANSKGGMDKGGHYDVEMKGWMQMMCKLTGGMHKDRHYDMEIKGWMEKVAL